MSDAVDVAYVAPAECPSDARFWDAFAARAPHTQRVDAHGAWSLVVEIAPAAGGFTGRIHVLHGAMGTAREVSDASCENVVSALAVIAAITVEPEPEPAPAPAVMHAVEPAPLPAPREPWHVRVGIVGLTTSYLSPSVSLGLGGWGELEQPGDGPIGLRVRVSFQGSAGLPYSLPPASAFVSSWVGRAELGGPRGSFFRGVLVVNGGLFVETGALVGEARGVPSAQSNVAPWVALGALGRVRVVPRGIPTYLEAGVGPVVPLVHPRFVFQPVPTVAYEAPPAGITVELAVGVRFL
jgi:hypothetical protein